MNKEGRGVLEEEMRETDECGLEEFGALDSSEKTVAISGDRWWPQAAKQEVEKNLCYTWKQRNERPTVGGVSTNRSWVLRLERGA